MPAAQLMPRIREDVHGALAAGLLTLPVDERLQRLAQLLIDAVDPCVESRVEVAEATGHA